MQLRLQYNETSEAVRHNPLFAKKLEKAKIKLK